MPEQTFSAAGDLNVAGDVIGHDKHQAQTVPDGPTEREWEALLIQMGKLQSDMMNVRTELAALRERLNVMIFGLVGLVITSGVIVLVIGVISRP